MKMIMTVAALAALSFMPISSTAQANACTVNWVNGACGTNDLTKAGNYSQGNDPVCNKRKDPECACNKGKEV